MGTIRRIVAKVTKKQEIIVSMDDQRNILGIEVLKELSEQPELDIIVEKDIIEWSEKDNEDIYTSC